MEPREPLFRLEDGTLLKRQDVQRLLGMAALAAGEDPSRVGSHSLRIGGATAMYHQLRDLDI
eukprot:9424411-Lingulodinium_polyedra.AAC.1